MSTKFTSTTVLIQIEISRVSIESHGVTHVSVLFAKSWGIVFFLLPSRMTEQGTQTYILSYSDHYSYAV